MLKTDAHAPYPAELFSTPDFSEPRDSKELQSGRRVSLHRNNGGFF